MKKVLYTFFVCVFFCASALTALAQQRTVTGTVTDEKGETLPGVSVTVKGTTRSAATDAGGKFSISVDGAQTLAFSFVGMQAKEVAVTAGQNAITVTLASGNQSLDEVVVVGYGSVKKSDLTGSVSTLKGSQLNKVPASSVDQLLQGKIAGVQVMVPSGQPGAGATIRIRGASSLNGSRNPLIVVDGFPWGDAGNLKQINPDDIESIEVLKDASSAAIYGSRGANGVIMVTTKKARAGTPRISLSTLNTLSFLAVKPDIWRDPVEEAIYANEAALNGGTAPDQLPFLGKPRGGVYYPSIAELRGLDPTKPQWPHNTDWLDLVYRNPFSQNYTLNIDGGNDNTRYSMSGNYYKEEGLAIKNYFDKYTGRLNLEQKLTKAINTGTNVILTYTRNNGQQLSPNRSRIFPVYDENGNYFRTAANDYGNPIAIANEVLNTSKTIDVLGTVFANAKITDWLQFRTQLSTKYGNSVGDNYQPSTITFAGAEANGLGSISNYNGNELLNENYFTIDKKFGTAHTLNIVGGFSIQKFESRQSTLIGRNFVNDNLKNENLESAATVQLSTPALQRSTLQSYYGRVNYTLNNKYLFTLTGRADGSTKFAKNNKWGYFPSGAFAWKANEETFIKNLNIFSELKFRASYGLTGNQGLSPYNSLERYGSDKYFTGTGFETGFGPGFSLGNDEQGLTILEGLANNSLKWETTRSFDVGVDIGFADQRFTLTLDYYDKHTSDLLRRKFLAPSSAFNQILINDGEISNKGFEVGLNANIITQPDLTWSVGGNFTLNRNKVLSIGESDRNEVGSYIEMLRQRVTTFTVGYPIFAYYGFESDGIIQTLDEGLAAGLTGANALPGEIKYKDISGPDGVPDGIVNDQYDRKMIGNPTPNFLYSFNTNVRYKQFDLSAQFYGVSGIDVLDLQKLSPSRLVQRWTPDNPSTLYPRANNTRGFRASDYFITDGSFLRVQNVTIGYNFKPKAIKGINSLRIFLSGNNLYTFTKFNAGFDPEVGEDGINWGNYPRPRAISIGLNVGF